MKKISLSSHTLQFRFGDKGALKLLKDSGFDAVDLNLEEYGKGVLPNVYDMPHDEFVAYFKDVKNFADKIGIEIAQTHSLCTACRPDEEYNKKALSLVIKHLEATSILGCKYCVIHSANTSYFGYHLSDDEMHKINQEMYNRFIPYAEKFGVCITLESFGAAVVNGVRGVNRFAYPEKMLREYESLNTEYKAFCMDTGHTNEVVHKGLMTAPEFIRFFGNRIKVLHLHDNGGFYDQHLIPKAGNIDWPEVFKALDDIGYDGVYNFELEMPFGTDHLEIYVKFLGGYLRELVERKGRLYIGPIDPERDRNKGPFR